MKRYSTTLNEYIDSLNEKFERGLLDESKYTRLAMKLVAWEANAIRKGVYK